MALLQQLANPEAVPTMDVLDPSPDEPGTVRLRVVRSASTDLQRASEALADFSWLGPSADVTEGDRAIRRIAANLELPVRDGSGTGPVRKAALIEFGAARPDRDGLSVQVSWRSATLAPLFPVFAGRLHVRATGLILDGCYAPPLGKVGLVIDRALLHFVAQRTAHAFLAKLASRFAA